MDGKEVGGSPFTCTVDSDLASASHCIVSGEALSKVVAAVAEHFYVSFRNSLGQLTHSSELDVCVTKVETEVVKTIKEAPAAAAAAPSEEKPDATKEAADQPPQTLVGKPIEEGKIPLGDFERLVVGPKHALSVSRTKAANSEKVAKLKPGRQLKILKLEPHPEGGSDGNLRALVAIPDDGSESWRDSYAVEPQWRGSLREHVEVVKRSFSPDSSARDLTSRRSARSQRGGSAPPRSRRPSSEKETFHKSEAPAPEEPPAEEAPDPLKSLAEPGAADREHVRQVLIERRRTGASPCAGASPHSGASTGAGQRTKGEGRKERQVVSQPHEGR